MWQSRQVSDGPPLTAQMLLAVTVAAPLWVLPVRFQMGQPLLALTVDSFMTGARKGFASAIQFLGDPGLG